MSFYGDLSDTALRLINQFGKTATITPKTSAIDPILGTVTDTTQTAQSFNVIEVDAEQAFGRSFSSVETSALYLLADNSQTLEPGIVITFDGKAHEIKKAKPIRPGGEVVAYGLEVVA